MAFHVRLSASCGKIFHIDGHAPMLHKGQAGDEFSAMKRYVALAADVIDSEICQRAEQTFTLRHNAAVGYAAKFGT